MDPYLHKNVSPRTNISCLLPDPILPPVTSGVARTFGARGERTLRVPRPSIFFSFSSSSSPFWGPFSFGAPGHRPPMPPTRYATARNIAEKQITGNEKDFLKVFLDVLETWEGQNIFSVKWQKWLILIKKSELKQKKKVRTIKICKTCVRTTRTLWHEMHVEGLQQKKKKNLLHILSVGYSNYSWYLPDMTRKT